VVRSHSSGHPSLFHVGLSWWLASAFGFVAVLALGLTACSHHPEEMLPGSWRESAWRYERVDGDRRAMGLWTDGVRVRESPERHILRHEAERWHFHPDGNVEFIRLDGSVVRARWRFKGRGHVLTLRFPDGGFEVYRVQELTDETLVLHYDMGVEVRGIARLEFHRVPSETGSTASSSSAPSGAS
jgi:hypothetical protein